MPHRGWRLAGATAAIAVLAVAALTAPFAQARHPRAQRSQAVVADPFTLKTPPLARGQIELLTLSTMPSAVTAGEALMEVRGVGANDSLRVTRNGRSVTAAFHQASSGTWRGMVRNLRLGRNNVTATVHGPRGIRTATLVVTDHPITGPVFSGPHQEPFICETQAAGLGKPLDGNCSVKTQYAWFYRSTVDQSFHQLANPYAPYPSDTASTTTDTGRHVPFVVRVESGTINRGIYRLAVLDDPAARGPNKPFRPVEWNRRLTYAFGESCGVGYHQGVNSPQSVLGGVPPGGINSSNAFSNIYGLTQRLGAGDVVTHSTMTTFGVYCNPLVSGETLMMMKEHVVDHYGLPRHTVGVGASGGALQQYNAANNYPGLLDAATPLASFSDIPSTAMTVVDCGLMDNYFGRSSLSWSDSQRAAVAGEATANICKDWTSEFLPDLDPTNGCDGVVPMSIRYNERTNPRGVRCTLQDATKTIWGVDPHTGFAKRPYDNVGVQYGLGALNAGQIDFQHFIDLNRNVGGFDLNAHWQPQRDAMDAATAHIAYLLGGVIGRGALQRIPIIDLATYLDLIPAADIHDDIRPFQIRARLQAHAGTNATQSIWRGVSVPNDAQPALTDWINAIDRRGGEGNPSVVASARPSDATDRCIVTTGGASIQPSGVTGPLGLIGIPLPGPSTPQIPIGAGVPETQSATGGACQAIFTAHSDPRMVAGGPLTDDVLKCRLKPVDPRDYKVPLTPAQLTELRSVFPSGVCDYSEAGVGAIAHSIIWPSIGGTSLATPHGLQWTVARSAAGG